MISGLSQDLLGGGSHGPMRTFLEPTSPTHATERPPHRAYQVQQCLSLSHRRRPGSCNKQPKRIHHEVMPVVERACREVVHGVDVMAGVGDQPLDHMASEETKASGHQERFFSRAVACGPETTLFTFSSSIENSLAGVKARARRPPGTTAAGGIAAAFRIRVFRAPSCGGIR